MLLLKGNILTDPYGIYIWQPPRSQSGTGVWNEPLQADTLEFALYVANLIHNDSRAVIKAVRYSITLARYPNKEPFERSEVFAKCFQ